MKKQTLRKWIFPFNDGVYELADRRTQIQAGWFDWFCRDTSLKNKTCKMGRIIKQIRDGYLVDSWDCGYLTVYTAWRVK